MKKIHEKKKFYHRYGGIPDDVDTHTVETHIYRLRKKIKEIFNDESFLKKVKKKVTQFEKRNKFAKDLMTTKYRSRIVKAKKGKGSFKRKKNISLTISSYNLAPTLYYFRRKLCSFSRLFLNPNYSHSHVRNQRRTNPQRL